MQLQSVHQRYEQAAAFAIALTVAVCLLLNGSAEVTSFLSVQLLTVGLLGVAFVLLPSNERQLAACLIVSFTIVAVIYLAILERQNPIIHAIS